MLLRQLADTDEELLQLAYQGISFSNVPGVTFEYSNLGFALLGKIITNISGMPYQKYITENIMKPIGMNDSKWEYDDVPKERLAHGYRWEDETWKEEALLHDGSYGAMGGLQNGVCRLRWLSEFRTAKRNSTAPLRRGTPRDWLSGKKSAVSKRWLKAYGQASSLLQ